MAEISGAVKSWAIFGAVVAGACWYYTRNRDFRRKPGQVPEPVEAAERSLSKVRNKTKGKARRDDPSGASASEITPVPSSQDSGNDVKKTHKGKNKATSKLANGPSGTNKNESHTPHIQRDEDEGMDDREFAKQLASAKAGTPLKALAQGNTGKRISKPGRLNGGLLQTSNDPRNSTPSSTTGADASDEMSPVASPPLAATHATRGTGDVSDMLEGPSAGPSVLRLTGDMEDKKSKKPVQKKAVPQEETKKQRQNRQKNEQKKIERNEAEKERRVLQEKQMKTAREARGEPAKNGVPVPKSNMWDKPPNGQVAPAALSNGALLDTFDQNDATEDTNHVRNTQASAARKAWSSDLPSEEEQMRMLDEMEGGAGWNTVQKKPKKKTKKEQDDEDVVVQESVVAGVGPKAGVYDPDWPYAQTGHPDDSDWPVV